MKEYFHDPKTRKLYKAPSAPTVTEKKDRRGNVTMTTVSAYIEGITFGADGSSQSKNNSYSAKDFYDSRDSREQAVRYFKTSKYPSGRISAEEYVDLYSKYSASQ